MRSRLVLAVTLAVSLLMAFFALDTYQRQRAFLETMAPQHALSLAQTLAAATPSWVLANDVAGLEEVLASVTSHPGLRYAMVLSPEGRVLGHSDPAFVGMEVADPLSRGVLGSPPESRVLLKTGQAVDAVAPVLSSGRLVGWARIGLGLEHEAHVLSSIRRDGLFFTLAAVALGGVAAVVIAGWLTRGLDELTRAVALVGQGLPKTRVRPAGGEIGLLGQAFNAMLDKLEANQESLLASESRLRALFETARDAILLVDPGKACIIDANPSACELFGLPLDRLLLRNLPELFSLDAASGVQQALSGLGHEGSARLEAEAMGQGGGRCVEMSLASAEFDCGVRVVCVLRDVSAQRKAQERVLASLREKEILLKEVHHRVKNNMQVVISLINLQAQGLADEAAREVLEATRGRIYSMASVHERLYASHDLASLDMSRYVPQLAGNIRSTWTAFGRDAELIYHLDGIRLPVDQAIPCGLILNELVSNSFKHAFGGREAAQENAVTVSLLRQGFKAVLEVSDNGRGFPSGGDPLTAEAGSLGFQIVLALAGQLGAQVSLGQTPGSCVRLVFPLAS